MILMKQMNKQNFKKILKLFRSFYNNFLVFLNMFMLPKCVV